MKAPAIPCHECGGTGQEPMPEGLLETLSMLGRKMAVAQDLTVPGMTRSAINNRLESLRALGFVQRQRRGKFWVYSAVTKKGWRVVSTAMCPPVIMLEHADGRTGTVATYSRKEWADAYYAPSKPYPWTDESRIVVTPRPPKRDAVPVRRSLK